MALINVQTISLYVDEGNGGKERMGTAVVGLVLTGIVICAIRSMVRDRKKGKSIQCGGDCSRCMGGCR